MLELTQFFMWCTIINGGLLLYTSAVLLLFPNFVFRLHSRWFPLSRDAFNVTIYAFLGFFKILFFVFNLAPYLALRIITQGS